MTLSINSLGKCDIMSKTIEIAAELIKGHEGLRLKPYRCTTGKLTIGYGRNLDDQGITKAEAKYLLTNDLNRCLVSLEKEFVWFLDLDDVRRAVLVDMAFNMGLAGLKKFKMTLTAVEKKDYEKASRQMMMSVWAGQVGGRALRLAHIMRNGEVPLAEEAWRKIAGGNKNTWK